MRAEERIIACAIATGGGLILSLPAPARHHHIIQHRHVPIYVGRKGAVQGFLTDSGRFVSREEAYIVAITSGQLHRAPGGYTGQKLFSEDLW